MSVSGSELLRRIKEQIDEVDPSEVRELLGRRASRSSTCARAEECRAGPHPRRQARAARLPRVAHRGRRSPDRSQRVILYCASGNRSRARRQHADRGARLRARRVDDRRHHAVEGPRLPRRGPAGRSRPSSASATRATCCCPRSAPRASRSCSTPRCCCSAPAASARRPRSTSPPPASARSASSTTTSSTSPTSSARSSTRPTASACRRSTPPRRRSTALNPDVQGRQVPDAPRRLEHHGDHRGLRHHRRRRRQLPDALPAQRRDRAPAASRSSSAAILGFDGQLSVFKPYEGPCYRCLFRQPPPAELAPSCGANGVLGVLPGHDGPAAGDRGRQAHHRRRRAADRAPAACTTRSARRSPSSRSAATPSARSARASPDEITDDEIGVFPDYEAFCAAAG